MNIDDDYNSNVSERNVALLTFNLSKGKTEKGCWGSATEVLLRRDVGGG